MKSNTFTKPFCFYMRKMTNLSLKLHINSHDGLKLYKCEECGKGYGSTHEPQWHMTIHISQYDNMSNL
jgi:hypothetical protein